MKKVYLLLFVLFISVTSFGIAPITGITTVCVGTTSTLADATPGGVWTSSNRAIASVGSGTGIITGIAAGSANITYTVGTAYAYRTVYVFSSVPAMSWSGPTTFCAATYGVSASNAIQGGVYSSSDTSIVRVRLSGGTCYVLGVSAGTAVITYSAVGCGLTTKSVTIKQNAVITGPPTVCEHDSATYRSDVAGGYWWTDIMGDCSIDSLTGVLTAIHVGDYYINYTSPNSCVATAVRYGAAAAIPITGPSSVCISSTIDLKSGGGWGHTWTSSRPAVATVADRSFDGPVTGVSAGTTVITYSTNENCIATHTITVTPGSCTGSPAPGVASIASIGMCSGAADTFSLSGYTPCGTVLQWQSSPDSITWSDVAGATYAPIRISPLTSGYIRCKNTCAASGLSSYSNKIYTPKQNSITAHSILVPRYSTCPATNFRLKICGVSNTLTLITHFGDGQADTMTPHYVAPDCDASIIHDYNISGTYSVKHILLQGGTRLDSVLYDYEHLNCYIMPIEFFFDRDSDCVYDFGDWRNFTPIKTEVDSNGIPIDTVTISGGMYYRAYGPGRTVYTFRPLLAHTGLRVFCPSSGVINDTVNYSGTSSIVKYFSITCDTTSGMDLSIQPAYSKTRSRFEGYIRAFNNFRTLQNATVTMQFSPKYRAEVVGMAGIVTGNTITWNLTGLAGNIRPPYLYFRCAYRDSLLTIGDTIQTSISITPTTGDADVTNNYFFKVDTIRAGYDPNMIEVSPEDLVLPCDELLYTVHFENTGNDTAHNIHVMDTLSDNVELRGMQIIAAPEGMRLAYTTYAGHNVVKFDFPNINLLDSSHHGQNMAQFSFRVKVKRGLPDGIIIPNRVGIYFDDNKVVMTNQVENTIGMPPIVGPDSIWCSGSITLTCTTPGGIWTASNANATVAAGTVTGVAKGIDTIIYTKSNACTSRSSVKPITIYGLTMTAGITTSPAAICAGVPAIFTAATANAGATPTYLWRVNGTPAGVTPSITYAVANGDVVSLTVNGSIPCALPLAATVADTVLVYPVVQPAVTIAGLPTGALCQGTPVVLTAVATNGGAAPTYQWRVNGVATAVGAAYTYTPQNADVVAVTLTSNKPCASPATGATQTTITVTPTVAPVVAITSNRGLTIYKDETIVCRAEATDTGATPTYRWLLNGVAIAGATTATFVTATLADGDALSCEVTPGGDCAGAPTTATVVFSVSAIYRGALSITPNPTNGTFILKGSVGSGFYKTGDKALTTIKNVVGQQVYSMETPIISAAVNAAIQLPANLPKGNYVLTLRANNNNQVMRFVLE